MREDIVRQLIRELQDRLQTLHLYQHGTYLTILSEETLRLLDELKTELGVNNDN